MSNTSAQLGNLLELEATRNYYVQQQTFWAHKNEANTEILSKQQSYQGKFEDAQDKAINNTSALSATHGGRTVNVTKENTNETLALQYAEVKVWQYDADYSEELAALDIEYDTMKTMYDTLLEEINAEIEAAKSSTSQAAQDTCLLNS